MELDPLSIGIRIKDRRNELHLTQTDIKSKVGISSGNMSDIERGNRLPAATTLFQLAQVLDCSVDYILTGNSPCQERKVLSDNGESKEEKILLDQFRFLSEDDKEEIMMMVQLKYNRTVKAREKEQKSSLLGSSNAADEIA